MVCVHLYQAMLTLDPHLTSLSKWNLLGGQQGSGEGVARWEISMEI